jgi:hypothetical protein
MRWKDSNIPEYDLDTDEIIYRDTAGNELKRENFNESRVCAAPDNADRLDRPQESRVDS